VSLFNDLNINDKQRAFVEHYVETFNAQESCRRAGYSPKSVMPQSANLMKNPQIQEAINRHRSAIAAKHEITRDQLAEGLVEAFSMARARERPNEMVSAIAALAKLTGLMIDQRVLQTDQHSQTHLEAVRTLSRKSCLEPD
tara:strand:- start:180 stop:602 length:423 start_codon:yes stop_codon:yes gene_type:complete